MKNKLFMRLKIRLLSPHPYSSIKDTLSFSLFVMLYVTVILFINFANINIFESLLEYIVTVLVFAIAVGIVPVINSILLKYIIPKRVKNRWKVIGEILIYQIHFISIGIVNGIIANHFFPVEKNIINLVINILITYAIGIFPVSFMIVRKQNVLIKSRSLNIPEKSVTNGSEICYVESVGNYIEITYSNNEKQRLRSTLKDFLRTDEDGRGLNRIHRAYAANLSLVKEISGNSQGMKISFESIDENIPVSRKYVRIVRSLC